MGADDRAATVLVVDDTAEMRLLLGVTLGLDDRFDMVGEAVDGWGAIDTAERLQPDLIVLDDRMPGLSGLEAIPEIRRRSPTSTIVVYTANLTCHTAEAAIEAGAARVVDRTSVVADLLDVLSQALTADCEDRVLD